MVLSLKNLYRKVQKTQGRTTKFRFFNPGLPSQGHCAAIGVIYFTTTGLFQMTCHLFPDLYLTFGHRGKDSLRYTRYYGVFSCDRPESPGHNWRIVGVTCLGTEDDGDTLGA